MTGGPVVSGIGDCDCWPGARAPVAVDGGVLEAAPGVWGPPTADGDVKSVVAAETDVKNVAAAEGDIKNVAAAEGDVKNVAVAEGDVKNVAAAEGDVKSVAAAERDVKRVAPTENGPEADAGAGGLDTVICVAEGASVAPVGVDVERGGAMPGSVGAPGVGVLPGVVAPADDGGSVGDAFAVAVAAGGVAGCVGVVSRLVEGIAGTVATDGVPATEGTSPPGLRGGSTVWLLGGPV